MLGHFGFSYVGLIYLLMLFIPNLIWSRSAPKNDNGIRENKILLGFERVGQVCCSGILLIFSDFNLAPWSAWSLWLTVSFLLMVLYEICWIRYFTEPSEDLFYRSFLKVPLPLATLPVLAFLLLGVYGNNIWLIASSIIIGIGHIGIHMQHYKALRKL